MSDTNKPQHEAPSSIGVIGAILAIVALVSVMLMSGPVGTLGSVEVNAATVVLPAPDQIAGPQEHSAFIREGHTRAALDGEDAPLPPTF